MRKRLVKIRIGKRKMGIKEMLTTKSYKPKITVVFSELWKVFVTK
jgi:hypothetical protein